MDINADGKLWPEHLQVSVCRPARTSPFSALSKGILDTMGATSHYVVQKRPHPGSSEWEIHNEPNWGAGHNHRVGFKNRENRVPGYTSEEARGKYLALRDRFNHGDLVNFRDIINSQEDLHLISSEHRSLGWRYVLDCTEDWLKYEQMWPANEGSKKNAPAVNSTAGNDSSQLHAAEGGRKDKELGNERNTGGNDTEEHGDLN